ncbi:MAG: ribonuclease HII [Acidobacteria bacterium]|jgi:ribonuclease HII|nr:ribonuclease HII [Acidobacteriota bacterium]MBA4183907.1 ribonuclease HII [Acidobacteriota bacterium]
MGDAEKKDSSQTDESNLRVSASPRLRVSTISLDFENRAVAEGFKFITGVDEVGRGCLAGAVVAAAVILNLSKPLPKGLNDSKKITAKNRERIADEIRENAVCYAIAQVEADEIDRINILQATKKAMITAVGKLNPAADFLLIDALGLKEINLPQKAIIGGDAISASIAAASIIAKTYRDNLMRQLDEIYPEYGFSNHVGYGTKQHFEALRKHGACPLHRKTFRGVLS